jgi:hypothetical protein
MGRCTRRAFQAVKNADLGGKASGDVAVYGSNRDVIVYVICSEGGRWATIFCASDQDNSGKYAAQTCDTVSRFMER